jgi:hypothetical protein
LVAALWAVSAGGAGGQTVEVAPFAGFQFGGSVRSPAGTKVSLGATPVFGGTVNHRVSDGWRVELLYSRQATELGDGLTAFDVTVERYLAGVVEERGEGRSRFFGVGLAGATRFVPGLSGYGSEVFFTLGLSLGVKHLLSDAVGIRAEARGFYVVTDAEGGLFCRGGCLFVFSGSGLWQGDVSAGVFLSF